MTDPKTILADMAILVPVCSDLRIVECIASIDVDGPEVVIALNGATSAVKEACATIEGVKTVFVPRAGIGGALAAAVEATGRRYLVFTDSDCRFDPGALVHLAEALAGGASIARGEVLYDGGGTWSGRLIAEARTANHDGRVNGYSPLLGVDRCVVADVGGYLFSGNLPFREDREFDFRLQLAGKVVLPTPATVRHAPQHGAADLRSAFRYGRGERLGRRMGLFATPSVRWTLLDFGRTLGWYSRRCRLPVVGYLAIWTVVFWLGLALQAKEEEDGLPGVAFRVTAGVPMWTTELPEAYAAALRRSHTEAGRPIERVVRPCP
ncbi:glycosyltransferase [Aquihabitans sp. G128]|uniref:glycosyltransferase n=1 Tax=Aquihabitans sp. G128 TaxID=2849779 RepID=UPI001C21C578|nr:glycosyltransferase [Aquihabitans sp. G128]QXC60511.1 glycosyltransferase [Aquihabitans sp. G128]